MRKALITISIIVFTLTLQMGSAMAALTIDDALIRQVSASPLGLTQVIITYDHQPTSADFVLAHKGLISSTACVESERTHGSGSDPRNDRDHAFGGLGGRD